MDSYLKTKLYFKGFQLTDRYHRKKYDLSDEAKNILNEVKEKGYAVVKNFLSADECERLTQIIDRLIEQYHDKIWVDEQKSDHRIHGSNFLDTEIDRFPNQPLIQEVVKGFYQSKIVNLSTLAAKLTFRENNTGSGAGWHRDSPLKRQIKTIVYLTDVKADNGPFQYIKGSHKEEEILKLQKQFPFEYDKMRFSDDEIQQIVDYTQQEQVIFGAPKGTLVFADTRGLHRGKPIENGERYALTNYFYSQHQVSEHLIKKMDGILVKP